MLEELKQYLSEYGVQLIAVSKTKTTEDILQVYQSGIRDFGENKVQEMTSKYQELPKDIRWHLIGHLQTNKVKYIAPFVSMIHSVDSIKLLNEIDKQAEKNHRKIDYLLQIHIATEESKYGLSIDECRNLIISDEWQRLKNVRLRGLMTMATNTNNEEQIQKEFLTVSSFFDELKAKFDKDSDVVKCDILCMGMSSDYKLAVHCGANMVRIGSLIFGERNYRIR
jgi:hypothetical protein